MNDSTVKIVGAGPGDADFLTIGALRLLREWAEVVVYDRLVDQTVLDFIPESVERIYAGKSCKKHVMTQDEINTTLVQQARLGKKVLRLKGGDPFIFGRGGEEMHALLAAGIACEIIPGISAASGISSNLGIPLTHRGIATGVQFVTGHKQKGDDVDLDWGSLSNPDVTVVLYMALTRIAEISRQLIAQGRAASTPSIVVENGTLHNQRQIFTQLDQLSSEISAHDIGSPSLIIIGDVVNLSPYKQ